MTTANWVTIAVTALLIALAAGGFIARLASHAEALAELKKSARDQGRRLGDFDKQIAILQDRQARRFPTRGVGVPLEHDPASGGESGEENT